MSDHYLSKKQLANYKQSLFDRKNKVIISIELKTKETQNNHAAETDLLDIASNLESKTRLISEIDRDTLMLKRIDKAIRDFELDFGYCVDCGVEIGIKRLNFDASASRCYECQNGFEKKLRLYNR
jgi:DnaK suppressor protein